MAIDASIYGQIRQPEAFNPLAELAQFQQLQTAQTQNKLAALGLQDRERSSADALAQQTAVRGFGADQSANYNKLLQTGNLKAATDYQKSNADLAKTGVETSKTGADAAEKTFANYQAQLGTVADPQQAAAFVTASYHDPVIGPILQKFGPLEQGLQRLQQASQDPQSFQQWKAQASIGMQKLADMAKVQNVNLGGTMVTQSVQPATGAVTQLGSAPITLSADTAANNATSRANNASTQAGENARAAANRANQLTIAGMGPGGQEEGISPAAIENAAARYNVDGTLPPMGMGASGAAGRRAILNRAAELATGSGTDQRVNQLDAKSASSALTQLTKSQAMNAAFENTANQNAQLALGLSQKMDRTGIPILNAGIQAWKSGTGSPEATQFAAANQTFVAEYAKIMSGGMGNGPVSDAARGKAEKLLTTSMTADQYAGNVKLLQTEMANRMKGFDDQSTALKARIRGGPAPAADSSPGAGGWTVKQVN